MQIVLTGFMAAGKTAVGRKLARRLGREFIDTDRLIEKQAGCAIAEIFASAGEKEFRRLEREVVAALSPEPPAVIATGGGTFVDERNRERLRELGVVVCLVTSMDTTLERTKRGGKRPLAAGGRAQLEKLFRKRMPVYRQADVLVETDGLTLEQSVTRVLNMIEPRLSQARRLGRKGVA
jgi:shikimate kinase/3-dehydroquinate synthase